MRTELTSLSVNKHFLKDDGTFPNNEELPLMIYRSVFKLENKNRVAESIENLLHSNKWGGSWRNGIYNYHHYHSTAHEVLCVYQGEAKVQLGGDGGIRQTVRTGDVIIIPAGVAHKNS